MNQTNPEKQQSADYARSKLHGEGVVREKLAGTSSAFSIIRPTLVYGESAPGNFGKLVGICSGFLPLPLGCANNQRSLVSLESLVNLIILCVERPEAKDQVFVAADATSVSTREIVCSLRSGMGKRPALLPVPRVLFRWPLEALGRAHDTVFQRAAFDIAGGVQRLKHFGGKLAGFFLVPGNPVEDFKAIKTISMVMADGTVYYPAEIYPEFGIVPFAEMPQVTLP